MKSVIKLIMTVVGLVLLLTAFGLAFLFFSPNPLGVRVLEKHLSRVSGVAVEIDRIRPKPFSGALEIVGLRFMQPAEYGEGAVLAFETVEVYPEWLRCFMRPSPIKLLRFTGGRIHLVIGGEGGNNLKQIAQTAAGQDGGAGSLAVGKCLVGESSLKISTKLVPAPLPALTLAPFEIKAFSEQGGVSPAKSIEILLKSVLIEILSVKGLIKPVAENLRQALGPPGA